MTGVLFLRTGVAMLVVGIVMGMAMGASQDFAYAPVHAHLNLVGGVLMMVAGLFYDARPAFAPRLRSAHCVCHALGGVLLPTGIYGSISGAGWTGPVVGSGAVLTLAAMRLFAIGVFRAAAAHAAADAADRARS